MSKEKKKVGRPSKFTKELQEEMLERLSQGESARNICREAHMLSWSAFCAFKRKPENKEFQDQYIVAWEDGLEAWEADLDKIAHDESRDLIPDGKGGFKSDNTAVNRDRLKIDTRKWIMCKRMPKKYGDKLEQEVNHTGSFTINFAVTNKEDEPTS